MKHIVKTWVGLYMESKQLLLIEKCICLTIISVNSVCKFSEIYLLYSLTVTTNSHFSKMALVGFNSFMTGFYMITASVMKELMKLILNPASII